MEKTIIKHQKLLNILKGYKKADQLILVEKKRRLAKLTGEDSLTEYDSLCKMWEVFSKKERLGRLEKERISFLLKRRRLLNKTGTVRKDQ